MNKSLIILIIGTIITAGLTLFVISSMSDYNSKSGDTSSTSLADSPNQQSDTPSEHNDVESIGADDVEELKIETLQEGSGNASENGNTLVVHYTGTLLDGQKFDSSLDRGEPFQFTLGNGEVIQGWDEGMLGMKVGEKRRLTIPSEKGYGPFGSPPVIPANAGLVFEVELLEIR